MPTAQRDHGVSDCSDISLIRPSFFTESEWVKIVSALRLSTREAQIVAYLVEDHNEEWIGGQIGISAHTVHTHVERLYRKTGSKSRCQISALLFRTYKLTL